MEEFCFGTGGLVKSYSESAIKTLEKAKIVQKDLGIEAEIEISYSDLQKVQYYFEKNKITIIKSEFNENVKLIFETTKEKFENLLKVQIFKILNSSVIKDKYVIV